MPSSFPSISIWHPTVSDEMAVAKRCVVRAPVNVCPRVRSGLGAVSTGPCLGPTDALLSPGGGPDERRVRRSGSADRGPLLLP